MDQNKTHREYNAFLGKELSTLLILSALKANKNSSTYDLIKNIKQMTDNKISFRAGTIYPHMVKLESQGILQKTVEDTPSRSEGVTRQKSVYSLTKKGMELLNQKKNDWFDLENTINQLLEAYK
jgi:PadR family transcriptional regulator PadR